MFGIARRAVAVILFLFLALAAEASSSQDLSNSLEGSIAHQQEVGAEQILAGIESNQPVTYNNVSIIGFFDLSKLDGPVRQPFRITNSTFFGPANFEEVAFGEVLDLRQTTFLRNVSFAKAQFQSDVNLAGTSFFGETDFRFARFGRPVSFSKVRFMGDVSFANSQFDGNGNFEGSNFAGDAKFDLALFSRPVTFMNAVFSRDLSFTNSQLGGTSIFMNSRFKGNASFAGTRFSSDVIFRSARFSGSAIFGLANFGGFSDFANVVFDDVAFFAVAKFEDNAHFLDARFNKDLILENARIYSMQLDNATFGKDSKINLAEADFTRLVVPWSVLKDRLEFNGAAYLALVKNYRNLEWFDDADNCYYQYRTISRANEPWGWSKLADVISWLSCGYGVRVSYTVFWCIFTIIFFGAIFWAGNGMRRFEHIGLEVPGNEDGIKGRRVTLVDAMYFSVAMFTTSQAPVNNYPVGVYRHLAMFEGVLGWFFLGLFVVVLSGVLIR